MTKQKKRPGSSTSSRCRKRRRSKESKVIPSAIPNPPTVAINLSLWSVWFTRRQGQGRMEGGSPLRRERSDGDLSHPPSRIRLPTAGPLFSAKPALPSGGRGSPTRPPVNLPPRRVMVAPLPGAVNLRHVQKPDGPKLPPRKVTSLDSPGRKALNLNLCLIPNYDNLSCPPHIHQPPPPQRTAPPGLTRSPLRGMPTNLAPPNANGSLTRNRDPMQLYHNSQDTIRRHTGSAGAAQPRPVGRLNQSHPVRPPRTYSFNDAATLRKESPPRPSRNESDANTHHPAFNKDSIPTFISNPSESNSHFSLRELTPPIPKIPPLVGEASILLAKKEEERMGAITRKHTVVNNIQISAYEKIERLLSKKAAYVVLFLLSLSLSLSL